MILESTHDRLAGILGSGQDLVNPHLRRRHEDEIRERAARVDTDSDHLGLSGDKKLSRFSRFFQRYNYGDTITAVRMLNFKITITLINTVSYKAF
jgi:hypothetical protein